MTTAIYPNAWSTLKFNPPIHRTASGAFTAFAGRGDVDKQMTSGSRNSVLGDSNYTRRLWRKAVIFQDRSNQDTDWKNDVSGDGTSYSVATKLTDTNRYGFRFPYNPSTLPFRVGVSTNVNAAILASGAGQAAPIVTDGDQPSISLEFMLNRVEDMQFLGTDIVSTKGSGMRMYKAAHDSWLRRRAAAIKRGERFTEREPKPKDFPDVEPPFADNSDAERYVYGRALTDAERKGLLLRGTGYDLEFLFRTALGRPYKSVLRGTTADIGVAYGVPLVLDLSAGDKPQPGVPGMRYRGRIAGISYTHSMFTPNMVPMVTYVNIEFVRFPDATDSVKSKYVPGDMCRPKVPVVPMATPGAFYGASTPGTFQNLFAYNPADPFGLLGPKSTSVVTP